MLGFFLWEIHSKVTLVDNAFSFNLSKNRGSTTSCAWRFVSILESLDLCCFWTTQTLGLINLPPSRQTQSTSINATVTFPLFKRKAHKLVPVLSQMLRVWPGRKISVKSGCLFFCGVGGRVGVWGCGIVCWDEPWLSQSRILRFNWASKILFAGFSFPKPYCEIIPLLKKKQKQCISTQSKHHIFS